MKAGKRTREILCLAVQKTEQNKAEKENVNKKKSNYEGQNDAHVLKTYNSDTMTQNMG